MRQGKDEEEIIGQLINGINRLPVLCPTNMNQVIRNKGRGYNKFTLDKLLV